MNAKISKLSLLVTAGAAVGLGGCQAGKTTASGPETEFSSSIAALVASESGPGVDAAIMEDLLASGGGENDLEALIQSSYETLARAFEDAESEPTAVAALDDGPSLEDAGALAAVTEVETPAGEEVLASSSAYNADGAGLAALMAEASVAAPAVEMSATAVIRSTAEELADAIISQLPFSTSPVEDAVALVGLEGLVPGVSDAVLTGGVLSEEEVSYIRAALKLSEALRSVETDPDAAVDTAQQIAMDISESRPIRIARAELCTRVEGYGQYTPFASKRFVAGKRHRVIVYVEVDRLGHTVETPATGETSPRFAVELAQRIEVYHSADDVLALATPSLTDRRVGRNRFRDYYLVTAVDLPETLSIGEYKIKITMRDHSDDGVSQAVIPLTIVADRSALVDTP